VWAAGRGCGQLVFDSPLQSVIVSSDYEIQQNSINIVSQLDRYEDQIYFEEFCILKSIDIHLIDILLVLLNQLNAINISISQYCNIVSSAIMLN